MKRKAWTNKKFVSTHPSGTLATSLILVKEIMAKDKEIPLVSSKKNMNSAINTMTKKKLGVVVVKLPSGKHELICDGDLRRHSDNLFKKKITQVTTKNPIWISEDETALSALEKMARFKISSLLVFKKKDTKKKHNNVIGIVTLKECLSRGIK